MVTVGLDLHKRYITACALDDAGTVLAESRRLEPTMDTLGRWLGALPQPLTIALEATLYWHWLEQQLTALGHRVVVAHPYQVKLIWQARTKTDPIDARKLAELARVNLLPAIWIPDPATRALRQLLRGRVFLVRQGTVMRNRIHAWLTAEILRCPELDLYTKAGQAWLTTVELAAYAGLVPSTRSSGDKTRHGHVGAGEPLAQVAPDRGAPDAQAGAGPRGGSL